MIEASRLIHPDEPFVLRQRRPDLADDDAFLHFARRLDGLRVESVPPERRRGVLPGFVLDLTEVWQAP